MQTVYIQHPNPTLGLPTKKLYEHKRSPIGCSTSIYAANNVAFSTSAEMFKFAIQRTTSKPGLFVVVAWAFVNGTPIDPIGFLCFDEGTYLFTPINLCRDDYSAYKAGTSINNICHKINNEYREKPLELEGRRGWFFVDKSKGEKLDEELFVRASNIFSYALFRNTVTMEKLYEMSTQIP